MRSVHQVRLTLTIFASQDHFLAQIDPKKLSVVSPTAATFYFCQSFWSCAGKPSAGNSSARFPWVKWTSPALVSPTFPRTRWTWLGFAPPLPGTFSGIFCGTLLNPDLALHQSLPNLLRNLLQNPVERELAQRRSLPEPCPDICPEPSPEPCWTWHGSAPKPPTPSPEPSPEALVQSQARFIRVPEKVTEKVQRRSGRLWCKAGSGSTGFRRRFRGRFREALVES